MSNEKFKFIEGRLYSSDQGIYWLSFLDANKEMAIRTEKGDVTMLFRKLADNEWAAFVFYHTVEGVRKQYGSCYGLTDYLMSIICYDFSHRYIELDVTHIFIKLVSYAAQNLKGHIV